MARTTDVLTALTIPTLILLYLSFAPYTKIEESFTIQATHDILLRGIPIKANRGALKSTYDHLLYPELHPVPRTFVAPIVLAFFASPFIPFVSGIDQQILVRAILGIYNAFCLLLFRNSIRRAYGAATANWYSLFQACQFHIMFYSSRTLPNFIPFGLCTVALGLLIQRSAIPSSTQRQIEPALIIITVLGIVFRSELALFLAVHTVFGFVRGYLAFRTIVVSGIIGVLVGILVTVPVDSFFWQQYPLWPELSSFLFNVYEGKSIEWGTSPWFYYFTNAMPKVLFNPIIFGLCIPLSIANSSLRISATNLLVPNLLYIAIYSLQPHKEWRFIVYTIPALTAAGAQGAAWIWRRRGKSATYRFLALSLVLSVLASLAASIVFTLVSTMNYPGAQALHKLQVLADGTKSSINVHMDVLAAQTGATLFLQLSRSHFYPNATTWSFDKTDDKTGDGTLLRSPEFWNRFDYALAERPEKCMGAWDIIATVDGLAGVSLLRPGDEDPSRFEMEISKPPRIFTRPNSWGQPPWAPVSSRIWKNWKDFGTFMRRWVTRGWWVDIKMQPMIRILKRIPQDDMFANRTAKEQ